MIGKTEPDIGFNNIWVQSDRLVVVIDGVLILTKIVLGKTAIVIRVGEV